MTTDRMSFDEACRELGLTDAELENLVAAGEIATIKEGDTLYFKKEVVRKFKKQRETEPTILLADSDINLLDDAEEIDLLAADEEGTTPVKPAVKVEVGKGSSPLERLEISLEDDAELPEIDLRVAVGGGKTKEERITVKAGKVEEPGGDETLLNMDGLLEEDSEATTPVPGGSDDATMLDTDLLDLSGESDPFSADTAEETSAGELTETGTLLRSGGARVMQMKRKTSHSPWTVVLALSALLLLAPLGALTNLIFASAPETRTPKAAGSKDWIKDYNFLEGVVESLADFFKK